MCIISSLINRGTVESASSREKVFSMGACASKSLLYAKTQKLFGQDAILDKDAISRLPADILVHILSFLSTKEAIKTSILSKRWKYLWVSVPNFSFSDYSLTDRDGEVLELGARFLDLIERALFLQTTLCLGDFYLSLKMHVGSSRLNSWLSAAIEYKARKLDLFLPDQEELVLPGSLFSSKSLRHFSLNTRCTLKVPSFISLSGLERLHLTNIAFQDDQSAEQLFSACPVLKNLSLDSCDWENIKEISIESPTLRSFFFGDECCWPDPLLNGKIIISALNLKSLEVSSYLTIELLPLNLKSLNSAKIDMDQWNGCEEQCQRLLKLLSGIHNVKTLHLSHHALENLLFAEDVEGHLPIFYNLSCLYGFVDYRFVDDEDDNDDDYRDHASSALVYILQKSPNLKTLALPARFSAQEQDMLLEFVLHRFLSSLKRFIIFNVDGNGEDLKLLKHVRDNAPLLNRLLLYCLPDLSKDLEKQEEIREQLRPFHGGAASCSIKFIRCRGGVWL